MSGGDAAKLINIPFLLLIFPQQVQSPKECPACLLSQLVMTTKEPASFNPHLLG